MVLTEISVFLHNLSYKQVYITPILRISVFIGETSNNLHNLDMLLTNIV